MVRNANPMAFLSTLAPLPGARNGRVETKRAGAGLGIRLLYLAVPRRSAEATDQVQRGTYSGKFHDVKSSWVVGPQNRLVKFGGTRLDIAKHRCNMMPIRLQSPPRLPGPGQPDLQQGLWVASEGSRRQSSPVEHEGGNFGRFEIKGTPRAVIAAVDLDVDVSRISWRRDGVRGR